MKCMHAPSLTSLYQSLSLVVKLVYPWNRGTYGGEGGDNGLDGEYSAFVHRLDSVH